MRENAIEWYTGSKTVTVSLTQKKFINKVKKLCDKYPTEARILAQNDDGSIYARIPLSALHLYKIAAQNGPSSGGSEEDNDEDS